jgi:ATP-dependent Clp protease ATP-binding subunit ClpA
MRERYTDQARRVVALAQAEARALHHDRIGNEHILLALTEEREGGAAEVLARLGTDQKGIRRQVMLRLHAQHKQG